MIGALVFAALSPFLYGLFGFIAGAVMALLYNWVASAIGGVKKELEAIPESFLVPPSSAPTPQVAG